MDVKVYKANPARMEKVSKTRDSFQLKIYKDVQLALNNEIVNLISVYIYNGHDASISGKDRYTLLSFTKKSSNNTSAFHFREFSPADLKVCLVCQHQESCYTSKNLKKTHCKICKMEYHVCDKCAQKVDMNLLSEEEQVNYRWSDYKLSVDDFKYSDHETYISKNFCSTACLETYKILPQEELE